MATDWGDTWTEDTCDPECSGFGCFETIEYAFTRNDLWKREGWDQCWDCCEWYCKKCKRECLKKDEKGDNCVHCKEIEGLFYEKTF